jgi:eukaryotic-like serine/threonine-protein kinase
VTAQGAGAAGRRLGRYHLAESLGGGPTGEVFRAKVYGVAGFERQFAVKRFHSELVGDPDRAGHLAQAARVYASLQHPRIARLHEFGVAGSETFAATELVRGVDLGWLLGMAARGGALSPGASAALVAAAARALGFAHARGIAHLGVCPRNIVCTAEGDVKVTDFGYLAARLPTRPMEDSGLLGRLQYFAPEQLRGDAGTPATDVFQLGLVACELFTGQAPPGRTDPRELQRRAMGGEPAVELDLPRPMAQVIRRALALVPGERFSDATALADALDLAARAAPLAGDRRDLAALVRTALEQRPVPDDGASGARALATGPRPAQSGRVTMTGRPLPRPAQSRVEGGRALLPPSSYQAGQMVMVPAPAVVPAAIAGAPAPRQPAGAGRAETSEEPTHVREEERGQQTRVMPHHMVQDLVGAAPAGSNGSGANGAAERPPLGTDGRGRSLGAGSARGEMGDEESETRPHPRVPADGPPPSDPFQRDSDGDFYSLETVTHKEGDGSPLMQAVRSLIAQQEGRSETSTQRAEGPSPPTEALTPMPELDEIIAMTASRSGSGATRVAPPAPTLPPPPAAPQRAAHAHLAPTLPPPPAPAPRAAAHRMPSLPALSPSSEPPAPPQNMPRATLSPITPPPLGPNGSNAPSSLTASNAPTAPRASRVLQPAPLPPPPVVRPQAEPAARTDGRGSGARRPPQFAGPAPRTDGRGSAASRPQFAGPAPRTDGRGSAASRPQFAESPRTDGRGSGASRPPPYAEFPRTDGRGSGAIRPPPFAEPVPRTDGRGSAASRPPPFSAGPPPQLGPPSGVTRPPPFAAGMPPSGPPPGSARPPPPPGGPMSAGSPPPPSRLAPSDPRFTIDTGKLPAPRMAPPPGMMPSPPPPPDVIRTRPESLAPAHRPQPQTSTAPDTGEVVPAGPARRMPRSEARSGPPHDLDARRDLAPTRRRAGTSRGVRAAPFVALLILLAAGGYSGYLALFAHHAPAATATAAAPDAGAPAPAPHDGRSPPPASARSAAPTPQPSLGAAPPGRSEPIGELIIESEPARAQVYLDGALVGRTPFHFDGTTDRHKLAVIAPGYKPHTQEIDGRGKVSVRLEEVTPTEGPAGIKVRCRQKNRYYVYLDGEPTGQLCPTERLGVEIGEHTAEIYDPVSDTRRVYKVQVEDTRLSVRIRVD